MSSVPPDGDRLLRAARTAFGNDAGSPPPLTLRGGNAVDSYDTPPPFDPVRDEPSDAYLEAHAFWGVGYLDARSWRHYLPRLMEYALARPEDPGMVAEALVRSLRPPDRYPPRLATLSSEQEAAVVAFLEHVARGDGAHPLREDAALALAEWWGPAPRHRPTSADVARLRAAPSELHRVERGRYRLTLPVTLASSGAREIPEEHRTVEVWGGLLCGDAPATVAVNLRPLGSPGASTLREVLERAARGLGAAAAEPHACRVPGATAAERLDGWANRSSPAEPERIAMLAAAGEAEVVLLTVRSWPRADVDVLAQQIVESLELV